jgi:hypothetical protein
MVLDGGLASYGRRMRSAIFALAGISFIVYAAYSALALMPSVLDTPWPSLKPLEMASAVIHCLWPVVLAALGLVFMRISCRPTSEREPNERDFVVGGLQLIGWCCLIVGLHECFTGLAFVLTMASVRELSLQEVMRRSVPTVALLLMGWLCIWQRERMYRLAHPQP